MSHDGQLASVVKLLQGDHTVPTTIGFDVLGSPAPKGSSRAILVRGRAMLVPSSSDTNKRNRASWDVNVRDAARLAVGWHRPGPVFVGVPVAVTVTFRLSRPAGHWSRKGGVKPSSPVYPASKPDLDKLVRSTLDSLTGIVFDDDSRIVLTNARKIYAKPGEEGARLDVEALGEVQEAK